VLKKEVIRRRFLKERLLHRGKVKEEKDKKILKNLLKLPELNKARNILFYCAVKGEPDLTPLMKLMLKKNGYVILPKVEGYNLKLYTVRDLSTLKKGKFGIPEPIEGEIVDPESTDLAFIPGLIFDREGYRIGFGKGYYDRLLENLKATSIGVAYSFQVLPKIPKDPWDKPVHLVVTEEEIIRRF